MKHLIKLLGISLLLLGLSSCSKTEPPADRITLALNWLPEAEHGGYYAALLSGDYAEAGLNVEILPGGPDAPVIQRVGARRVTFGIANADRIALGKSQQADVVGLFSPLQHSPRCIMVHAESGISRFDQLENVTLAMSEAAAFSSFLKSQLPLNGVRIVRSTGAIANFLRDKQYAQQAYVFSEPVVARQQGADPVSLMVSELGFDPYSSVLIAHQALLDEQPELVRKFVQASRKGWQRYLEEQSETHQFINTLNPEMPVTVMDAGFVELKKLCLDEKSEFTGMMQPARWQKLVEQLEQLKLLEPGQVTAAELFRLDFLQ